MSACAGKNVMKLSNQAVIKVFGVGGGASVSAAVKNFLLLSYLAHKNPLPRFPSFILSTAS